MTLKKALLRGLFGFPLGVFLGICIGILISLINGSVAYIAVAPSLIVDTGTELNAFIFQFFLSGVLGFAFALGSAIFEVESWGITKQSLLHFLLSSVSMFSVAYFCHWMEHNLVSAIVYFSIFIGIYVVIWVIQFLFWKKKIRAMNEKLRHQ